MGARALLSTAAFGAVFGAFVAACVSFDLDSRRYRCEGEPEICGEGWTCAPDGFCVKGTLADGSAPGDGASGPDAETGDEDCTNGEDDDGDDLVDCEDDDCDAASCGVGCTCTGGEKVENACGDMQDNDGDDLIDCNDPDCPSSCNTPLVCCSDGCQTSC